MASRMTMQELFIELQNRGYRVKEHHMFNFTVEGSENIVSIAFNTTAYSSNRFYAEGWDADTAEIAVIHKERNFFRPIGNRHYGFIGYADSNTILKYIRRYAPLEGSR